MRSLHLRGLAADLVHFAGPCARSYGSMFNYSPRPPPHNPNPADGRMLPVLTLGEARRVVVDVGEGDADGGGPREPAHLASHVLGLDHHLVVLLHLPVHTGEGGLDQAWEEREHRESGFAPSQELGLVYRVCGIKARSHGGFAAAESHSDLCCSRQDGDAGAVIGRIFKRCCASILSAGERWSLRRPRFEG